MRLFLSLLALCLLSAHGAEMEPGTADQAARQNKDLDELESLISELTQEVERFKDIAEEDGAQVQKMNLRNLVNAAVRSADSTPSSPDPSGSPPTPSSQPKSDEPTPSASAPPSSSPSAPSVAPTESPTPSSSAAPTEETTTREPSLPPTKHTDADHARDKLVDILHRLTSDVIAFREAVHDILLQVFNVAEDIGLE